MLLPQKEQVVRFLKGQMTITNLFYILIMWLMFFFGYEPIFEPMAALGITFLNGASPFYAIQVLLIQMCPLIVLITMTVSIWKFSEPRYG